MTDYLDSTNLIPFKRRHRNGFHLPDLKGEQEEHIIDEVDPDLRPEEQGFVRHYLAYADILLRRTNETFEYPKGASLRPKVTETSEQNGTNPKGPKNNAA